MKGMPKMGMGKKLGKTGGRKRPMTPAMSPLMRAQRAEQNKQAAWVKGLNQRHAM